MCVYIYIYIYIYFPHFVFIVWDPGKNPIYVMHNLSLFSVSRFSVLPTFRKWNLVPLQNLNPGSVFVHQECSLLFAQGHPVKHMIFPPHTICMKKLVNSTHSQQPWVGSQRPLVVYAAAADTVHWVCVKIIVISTPNHCCWCHFFMKPRLCLYIYMGFFPGSQTMNTKCGKTLDRETLNWGSTVCINSMNFVQGTQCSR
jgi:hypothetical protein